MRRASERFLFIFIYFCEDVRNDIPGDSPVRDISFETVCDIPVIVADRDVSISSVDTVLNGIVTPPDRDTVNSESQTDIKDHADKFIQTR